MKRIVSLILSVVMLMCMNVYFVSVDAADNASAFSFDVDHLIAPQVSVANTNLGFDLKWSVDSGAKQYAVYYQVRNESQSAVKHTDWCLASTYPRLVPVIGEGVESVCARVFISSADFAHFLKSNEDDVLSLAFTVADVTGVKSSDVPDMYPAYLVAEEFDAVTYTSLDYDGSGVFTPVLSDAKVSTTKSGEGSVLWNITAPSIYTVVNDIDYYVLFSKQTAKGSYSAFKKISRIDGINVPSLQFSLLNSEVDSLFSSGSDSVYLTIRGFHRDGVPITPFMDVLCTRTKDGFILK